MNNNWKLIGMGFLGGLLPLGAFLLFNGGSISGHTDQYQSFSTVPAHRTSFMPSATPTDFIEASENSINSVVHVTTKVVHTTFQRDPFQEFFYGPGAGGREFKQYGSGSGSGVIVSADGYIVTNNHVIENASEIEVILNDNSKYVAKIVGSDPSTDIAVLKVEAKNLNPIPLGNSDDIRVGEWVLAVGNPFNLTSTVTAGIVSAKARNINLLADRNKREIVPIESFIQTDAAVNPGNSGGALVNTRGELVGINTAIASQTGSYAGYSFAVPVNLVRKVMSDLIDYGVVQRGYLGVQISDINQEIKEKNNLPNLKGVFVGGVVEGGSAEKAGLKEGDVILKVGSKEVNSSASLQEEIGKGRPGDKVVLTIRKKNGNEELLDVILRNSAGETKLVSKEEVNKNVALGATFAELTAKEKKELNTEYGVKIKSLTAGKLQALGLKEGMVITKMNNEVVKSVEQLTTKLNTGNTGVLLEILTESGRKEYVGFGL
ncbi:Do family serine endopeptidase [Crocinitomicaceae bacterium CZZ-1]|uniref:Do family serine endopeptidase n=1 Tax=Taishania pollutisoli TaxID=2766479 RepID=A0A8J6PL86_9FLAO|nr:Do family serine endopeptidase [Taishania pollutisoli]MBC9813836.1 Do family serine endopeptidase [Taishania pollutisoli]MBX2948127.1 Do family serine endopeptidase [Crocinitomicaceae bacterium]NGF77374.1 Do family serine endopeptidase [Fluviicola sp. SGL-29]